MLKKFILVGLIFAAISCNKEQTGYNVSASINDVKDSTKVFLNVVEGKKLKAIDTTLVIKNAFEFKGTTNAKDVHFITVEGIRSSTALILENDNINITMFKDSIHTSKVEGTKENELLQAYTKSIGDFQKNAQKTQLAYREASKVQDTVKMKDSRSAYDEVAKAGSEYNITFINENINSQMAVFVLERILNNKSQTAKTVKELFDKLPENSKLSRSGKNISETLINALATAEGSIAPNFSAPTPTGELLALNDVKGKVTIVDFWAAWCGPCRRENPNVVNVYNKFHDKGLEIIGVSLDGNTRQQDPKAAWLKAIEDDKLPWHQVSNLKYFNDDIAKLYNITSIPATFILDSEGVIIAKNLRGKALEDKIAELLN